jgi:hypothetical protein
MSGNAEGLLTQLRDELGLEAVVADGECPGCRAVVAEVDGLRHTWHEPDCELIAYPPGATGEDRASTTNRGSSATTWERGWRIGHAYAVRFRDALGGDDYTARGSLPLRILAAGLIPEDLRSEIVGFLADPDDTPNVSRLCDGFSAGVAAFLEEDGAAVTAKAREH